MSKTIICGALGAMLLGVVILELTYWTKTIKYWRIIKAFESGLLDELPFKY